MHINEVDQLFSKLPKRGPCTNPVTGGGFIRGLDPVGPEKRIAQRALRAREWFAEHGPPDLPPLPLSLCERDVLKSGGPLLHYILSCYSRSVADLDYAIEEHPGFNDYAGGVMASDNAPPFVKKDEELRRRFPPRVLPGLGAGLFWIPKDGHPRPKRGVCGPKMGSKRRSIPRAANKGMVSCPR